MAALFAQLIATITGSAHKPSVKRRLDRFQR